MINLKKFPNYKFPIKFNLGLYTIWCAIYAGTSTYLLQHFSGTTGGIPVWIPEGIGLAILLLYGWRYWPIIFIGAILGEMGGGYTFFVSVELAFGALLGSATAYTLLTITRFDQKLATLKDYILLIMISAFSALVSTYLNIGIFKLGGLNVGDSLTIFTKWYLGDFFGMAFFTPVLLILCQSWNLNWSTQKKVSFYLSLLVTLIAGQAIFYGWFTDIFGDISSRAILLFIPIILFGFYFGRQGVILLFSLILIQSTLSTVYGDGFFGPSMYGTPGALYIWVYLASMSAAGIVVSLVVEKFNNKNQALKDHAEIIIKTESYFKEMVNQTPIMIAALDLSLVKLDFLNPHFTRILGYTKTDFVDSNSFWTMAFPNLTSKKIVLDHIWKQPNLSIDHPGNIFLVDSVVVGKDGELKVISWGHFITKNNVVIYGQDITDQKKSKNLLNVMSAVYQVMGDAVAIQNADNCILEVNEAFCKLTGYSEPELVGLYFYDFFILPRLEKELISQISIALHGLGRWEGEVNVIAKNGEQISRFMTVYSLFNDQGAISKIIALISEVTDFRKAHELIFGQANLDHLTQLPNRRLLMKLLEKSIQDARIKKQYVVVIFLDIDNFKNINDGWGHDFGDQLLVAFSKKLRQLARSYDVVGRMGGDEFVIFLNNLERFEDIEPILQDISFGLAEPITINGDVIYTTSSLGVSVFPDNAETPESLLLSADQAMYVAKSLGRNNYQFFSATLKNDAFYRAGMLIEIRRALGLKQFELFYQPIYDLETNTIAHAEALLRWRRSNGELVLPSNFINESEESGLIIELGQWVMSEAIALLSSIKLKQGFSLAINVSALQLSSNQHSALNWLSLIKSSGLRPECFTFEITERIILTKSERVLSKVAMLQSEGCKFSIDDFGTGYSSLGALRNLNFDFIKIDGGFVQKLTQKGPDSSIVIAMIAMAQAMDLKTIAEGVETAEQAKMVKQMGCNYGQGYYYAEPMPEQEFRKLFLD